eukprot:TRINITY_DN6148_c1_g1_i10.p1 TRINITY_DN6148_c1_g1~~TRINITY_DN6148_c1_g1_i10.p1  ORF type:complete len:301 (+),score=41.89 TRINITY_DN6148_c1_g1_i10:27-929(+)
MELDHNANDSDSSSQLVKQAAKQAFKQANLAWVQNDIQLSRHAHDTLSILRANSASSRDFQHTQPHNGNKYIKSVTFGGLDGIITTFSVVAAVAGGSLAAGVVVIMGLANLLGDGLSMGLGDYLSSKAELEYIRQQYEKENWETENYIQGEMDEMVAIYKRHGMSEQDARAILSVMSKYRNVFVRTMMMEELDLMPPSENESPWKEGLVMFLSFCVFGSLPLIAYAIVPASPVVRFITSCIVTIVALALLGAAKGAMIGQNKVRSGLMMVINGGAAAGVSYLIAWGINSAAGISENCQDS